MKNIDRYFFLNIAAYLSFVPLASAQPSLIDRIQKSEAAIVTIQAQTLELEKASQSQAGLTPDGQLVVGSQSRAAMLEKTGAGIVIDPAGYIVTNTHTILYAQFIFVTLHDGTRLAASIASIAPESDFTILKVEPPYPLKALAWADSEKVQLDDQVISIGNSALWKQTIAGGTVKSIGRPQGGAGANIALIGMDLELDQGDSGGPILDRQGNFLGIVVAKNIRVARTSFAIPSNKIREYFLNYLNESGH